MPEVVMPRLSDTMEEGELTRWLKNVGDPVHRGDVLAEIETDKATMDLEAFEEGVLEQQLVTAGTVVPIGQAVAVIGDGSKTPAAPAATASSEEPEAAGAKPAAQEAAEAEAAQAAPKEPEAQPAEPATEPATKPQASGPLRTSPLARKIAREHGIDLATVAGTGPQGRIVRADIEDAIAQAPKAGEAAPQAAQPAKPLPVAAGDEEVAINNIRRVTARRLTESQAVPHFFLTNVVDAERLISFRSEVNSALSGAGIKVSINDLLVRAAAIALRAHPEVNSSWGGDKLIRRGRVNIGIAVALPDGLIVPVVTDADSKSLSEIAVATAALAEKARAGKLKLDEMSGGTFTISNLGMFGIDEFTAVINPPEAAILAVGAAVPVPELRDGELVAVPKMKITLTVDHRVLDGAMAAAFLRDLKGILEEPMRIVL
jgi:pyruvate dehydrogenase E2 component (dihydrolipoamide acetyltransferase)